MHKYNIILISDDYESDKALLLDKHPELFGEIREYEPPIKSLFESAPTIEYDFKVLGSGRSFLQDPSHIHLPTIRGYVFLDCTTSTILPWLEMELSKPLPFAHNMDIYGK